MYRITTNIIAHKFKIFLGVLFFALLFLLLKHFASKEDHRESESFSLESGGVQSAIGEISEIWFNPSSELLGENWVQQCFEEEIPNENALACNSEFLKCFIKHRFSPRQKIKINFSKNRMQDVLLNINNEFSISLDKRCHEVELPINIYSAGSKSTFQYVWDNENLKLKVDKYYVTQLEVYLWAKKMELTEILRKVKPSFLPALNLKKEEMENYCRSRGKYLLESRVLDAASFFPQANQPKYKAPYPWGKNKKSFLNNDEKLSKSFCLDAYVSGCEDLLSWNNFMDVGMSWTGVRHVLGSYSEYVRSTFDQSANLKISSMGLSRKSLWHAIGLRANWNEEVLKSESVEVYSKRQIELEKNIEQVAFRCMRIE